MRHHYRFSETRPSWWPENAPWPPPVRQIRHKNLMRRVGCFFLLMNLLGIASLVVVIALIARWQGLIHFQTPEAQWAIPVGVGLAILITLVYGVGGAGLRRVVMPLDDLLKAADRVGQGDYSVRIPERGPRELRSLARAFNDMASRLDQMDASRRDLLADVTHELRTPLTVVQGNLEGMIDGVYPADEPHLKNILEETQILSRLVDDLRTLALAESGALQLKKEPTDLALLVRETVQAFQTQADTKGILLSVETAPDLPWLELDPGRIHQVLANLLANSMRYTPDGGQVAVRYRLAEGDPMVEVQDSGPGIPADELPHVFERFYKSTDSGGMGLGLAIARRLVEAHAGTITAESPAGQGTTIRFNLPTGDI